MGFSNPIDDSDIYEGMSLQRVRDRADKAAIIGALGRQPSLVAAVAELGISRTTLYRRIQELGIPRSPREDQ